MSALEINELDLSIWDFYGPAALQNLSNFPTLVSWVVILHIAIPIVNEANLKSINSQLACRLIKDHSFEKVVKVSINYFMSFEQ